MTDFNAFRPIEYPDAAGYPDGAGFLDEGTADLVDEVLTRVVRQVDRPSADSEAEIRLRHDIDGRRYSVTIGDREIATLRYDIAAGRIVVLATTVEPEFRGRGIATDLIADALDDFRGQRMPVVVRCAVVAAFIAANPQFADLLELE